MTYEIKPTQELFAVVAQNLRSKPSSLIYVQAPALVANGCCAWCTEKVRGFSNIESVQEFKISGLCQICQDDIWLNEGQDENPDLESSTRAGTGAQ